MLFFFCKIEALFPLLVQNVYMVAECHSERLFIVGLCMSSVTLSHLREMIVLWSVGCPGFRSVRNVIHGCRKSISSANSSQVVFGVCPYFASSSALCGGSPHNLVGMSVCHIVCDSEQDVPVASRLLGVLATFRNSIFNKYGSSKHARLST